MSRTRRSTTTICAVLAAVVMTVLQPACPAAADPAADAIYTALGVDQVPADYVVMVDVSGSMQESGRYAAVKDGLRSFLAALAPDDQVALGTFADGATIVRQGPMGKSPDDVVAALPAAATGNRTDIGAAIEAAVRHLQRPGAPAIATVVLLTDGRHEPPQGSPYPYTQGFAWDVLTKDVAALRKTSLAAFAVPLGGATGAGLLTKVFPTASIVDPTSIDRLTAQLEQPKEAARAAKARSLLGADLTAAVEVRWPAATGVGAGRSTLQVGLHSTAAHLPLTVSGLAVTSGDGAVRATVDATALTLAPGATVTVPVTVDWDAGPRSAAPWSTVTGDTGLELTGTVGSPWSPVLASRMQVQVTPKLTGGGTVVHRSAQRGSLLLWIIGLAVLAVLVLLLLRTRRSRLRPALSGSLRAVAPDGDEQVMSLAGRSATLSAATLGVPGYGQVHAARAAVNSREVVLVLSYGRDGTVAGRQEATCAPGQTVVVDGVEFTWLASVPGPRRSVGPASGQTGRARTATS